MFKIGDDVVGNSRMSAFENRGAVGKIERGKQDNWEVRWSCGRITRGIGNHKLDRPNYFAPPADATAACDVGGIGAEVLATLTERGKQYDASGKEAERSMSKIVAAFNIITGQDLTEVQGWEFMQVLKQVRFFQNTGAVHRDSLIDDVAYSLLKSEAALNG